MKTSLQLYALTSNQATSLQLMGSTGIGGAQSSGHPLRGLKEKDDYVIVSPSQDRFTVHPLKGTQRTPVILGAGEHFVLGDLVLLAIGVKQDFTNNNHQRDVHDLIARLGTQKNLVESMKLLLEKVLSLAKMEKGLVINKNIREQFEVITEIGLDPSDPWLSETLIKETLKSQEPKFIQNIVGSRFESKKSLIATGFVALHAWPLVVRGEVLGVLLIGSSKPHSGLSELERDQALSLTGLGALMLDFHLREMKIQEELTILKRGLKPAEAPILTDHPPLRQTIETAKKIASADLSIVIHGETGVGKELLAQWIHAISDRSKGPLVVVNCGAIPSELIESLLFGHRKGSFTGAHIDQIGKFQMAHGGTLFLDEIGDLSLPLQVKLLRVLQEKKVEPIGSTRSIPVDVRVLAASHKSLNHLVSTDCFRQDLYYRLAEVTLTIPPLRERPADILLLASHFLKTYSPEKRFSTKAWEWLKYQSWFGNVRELQSTVKRAAIMSSGAEIQFADLLPTVKVDGPVGSWLGGKNLEEAKSLFVRQKVKQALALAGGNRTKAAELLGVTPRTLFRYLEDGGGMTDLSV